MEYVVVTGASSGIGKAIAEYLMSRGFSVIGIARSFDHPPSEQFIPVVCDLADPQMIQTVIEPLARKYPVSILVNAAGFGRFEPHEELNLATITQMTAVNLTAPMLLANIFLRSLKKYEGTLINITSIEATRHAKFSALYSATKAGLRAFGLSLFEEVRKSGVQVVTINPDMTDTAFFDELRFKPASDAALDTQTIADTVKMILELPKGATVTELTLRPQFFKIDKKS